MKKLLFLLCLTMGLQNGYGQTDIYSFKVRSAEGDSLSLESYKGKVMLIVNTATKCGFTPQYKELEALFEQYGDCGLEILDFPCNQFGQQAPGTILEIRTFCTNEYGVKFRQFDKVEVNGPNEAPLFSFLKAQQGFKGFNLSHPIGQYLHKAFSEKDPDYAKSADIKWNFTKFLVSRDGKVVARFEPTATAQDMEPLLKEELMKAVR